MLFISCGIAVVLLSTVISGDSVESRRFQAINTSNTGRPELSANDIDGDLARARLPLFEDYQPTWPSLDVRPLPGWYDEVKIGIFIHWGVFSVPGFGNEWFWNSWKTDKLDYVNFMKDNYPPGFTYQQFASEFTAQFFDPYKWADLFAKAGAKYVVLTGKHHEGFTLWPSKYSFSWNAGDVGPHRDLVGELAEAIRNRTSIHFGLYHSLYEWFNPLWLQDQQNKFKTDRFVRFKTMPELIEIVNKYKPEIVWSDGDWEAGSDYWKSKDFLAWLYNKSPVKDTVVTNDRWGSETRNKHGGFYTGSDRFNPGKLLPHKWENCMTLDKNSWGYRRNAQVEDYLTPEELISTLVETVSCGGNMLLNVGPTRDGVIVPIMQERLLQLGEWLKINGDAIYASKPWTAQKDDVTHGVWYTANPTRKQVYALVTEWPGKHVVLGSVEPSIVGNITIIGSGVSISWKPAIIGIAVDFPRPDEISSKWAWTVVINLR